MFSCFQMAQLSPAAPAAPTAPAAPVDVPVAVPVAAPAATIKPDAAHKDAKTAGKRKAKAPAQVIDKKKRSLFAVLPMRQRRASLLQS